MNFSYTMYQKGCFIVPMVLVVFALIIVSSVIVSVFKKSSQKKYKKGQIFYVFVLLFCVYMIVMSVGKLASGGIFIMLDKEKNAVELTGKIDEIKNINEFKIPLFKTGYEYGETSGVEITIGETIIKGPGCISNYVKLGDEVTIVYLPNSGYILNIAASG